MLNVDKKGEYFEIGKFLSNKYSTSFSNATIENEMFEQFDQKFLNDFNETDLSPREFINNFILLHYPNETAIKSTFLNNVLFKSNNHVSIFELKVGSSRIDLCKINGKSIAFEIKTELDTPTRLSQQMYDYLRVFDEVFLICSVNNYSRMLPYLPDECGTYTYYITNTGKYIFKKRRNALKSGLISPYYQLSALTKKDLSIFFNCTYLEKKNSMIDWIIAKKTSREINKLFKECLKNKFQDKWSFLMNHRSEILEIDYQWFYKNPLSPKIVYL
ncbi:sce7726 family protein [Virgibacillus sp. NKC19-3]|uniref:sce7726 family protein n=1 Tax=Virgibacillus saliphilus TaxID=2831674 RepID=UPI001C9B2870|nr:sce7726 family protein [Virgibacillus sp. NKC19-3]MBY7144594.1 sce7726 family protein [Virgibacillus sp. NKC19-3]